MQDWHITCCTSSGRELQSIPCSFVDIALPNQQLRSAPAFMLVPTLLYHGTLIMTVHT